MATEKAALAEIEDDKTTDISAPDPDRNFEATDVVIEDPKEDKPSEPEAPKDPGIAELRRQLEARDAELRERNAQIDAERQQRIQAERQSGIVSVAMVDQAIESAKQYRGQLRSQFVQAQTSGNYEAAADIQIAISQNEANFLALQQQKQYVEQQAAQPPRQPVRQQAQDMAAQIEAQVSPRSAQWIREHRDQVADERGAARVRAAHSYAVDIKGLLPDTDAYFAAVEETLGIRQPVRVEQDVDTPSKPAPRQMRVSAAAPARSQAPSLSSGRGQQEYRLNPKQVEHAEILGMTNKEYVEEILRAPPDVQKRLLGSR